MSDRSWILWDNKSMIKYYVICQIGLEYNEIWDSKSYWSIMRYEIVKVIE